MDLVPHDMLTQFPRVANRHDHTITLTTCLSSKEGIVDYVWQYSCFLASTGIAMKALLIDADLGATAATQVTYPTPRRSGACGIIYQNLAKHIRPKLGADYDGFTKDFANAQRQISQEAFWGLWGLLQTRYPSAIEYLDAHLTPNVELWASWATHVFVVPPLLWPPNMFMPCSPSATLSQQPSSHTVDGL